LLYAAEISPLSNANGAGVIVAGLKAYKANINYVFFVVAFFLIFLVLLDLAITARPPLFSLQGF